MHWVGEPSANIKQWTGAFFLSRFQADDDQDEADDRRTPRSDDDDDDGTRRRRHEKREDRRQRRKHKKQEKAKKREEEEAQRRRRQRCRRRQYSDSDRSREDGELSDDGQSDASVVEIRDSTEDSRSSGSVELISNGKKYEGAFFERDDAAYFYHNYLLRATFNWTHVMCE